MSHASRTRSKATASSSTTVAKKGGKQGKPSPPKKSPPAKKLKITPPVCSSSEADQSEDPFGEAANSSEHSSSESTKRSESTQELEDIIAFKERVVELEDGFDASNTPSKPSEPLPFESKGKKPMIFPSPIACKVLTKNIDSGSSFVPHSHYFCYNDHERDMVYYANRKVICEKNFDLAAHMVFGVIVKDFAIALNLPIGVIPDTLEFDKDLVLSELVGQKVSWNPSTSLSITDLTHTYAMLMRFALSNWMPSSNPVVVSQELAFFLFKIGSGAQIDLPSLIMDQIVSLRKAKKKGFNLFFPQLIFKILSSQKDVLMPNESVEISPSSPTFKSFEGKDQVSKKSKFMVIPSVSTATAAVPSGVGPETSEMLAVKTNLTLVQNQLGTLEATQQAILAQLTALAKGV
ncbi:uncharacterized protein LOC133799665 [Humulus lupulus]|uniref:uncharacterized protein LOC133799665 n=1 Tax=Humulus lupulus TaxID=3486 RepID=UPI002B407EE5|nr:uncharacterized protein LOC133799665 [Humulus lupulus]